MSQACADSSSSQEPGRRMKGFDGWSLQEQSQATTSTAFRWGGLARGHLWRLRFCNRALRSCRLFMMQIYVCMSTAGWVDVPGTYTSSEMLRAFRLESFRITWRGIGFGAAILDPPSGNVIRAQPAGVHGHTGAVRDWWGCPTTAL